MQIEFAYHFPKEIFVLNGRKIGRHFAFSWSSQMTTTWLKLFTCKERYELKFAQLSLQRDKIYADLLE